MNNKLVLVGLGLLALVLVTGAGFLFLSGKQNNSQSQNNQSSETTTNTEELPTSEPTEEVTADEIQVELTTSGFSPNEITINKGTKIVWTNSSGKAATVDSALHPVHTTYPPLNLGSFNDGETLELIFNETGTFKYHNHLNPSQNGSVIVK